MSAIKEYYPTTQYQPKTVKKERGIPTPTRSDASLGSRSWLMAMIEPVIIGAIAVSTTETWNNRPSNPKRYLYNQEDDCRDKQ
jgi:hypothetical protein